MNRCVEILAVILLAAAAFKGWQELRKPSPEPCPAPIIIPVNPPIGPGPGPEPHKRHPIIPRYESDSGEFGMCEVCTDDQLTCIGRRRPRPGPGPGPGPEPDPEPDPSPDPNPPGPPGPKPRPNGGPIKVGGPVAPDGSTDVICDLPLALRKKNVGGRDGAGLCVFTSIMHAARWQSERRLENFQADMRKEPGGGYPSKVDAMIKKYGNGTQYIQYEGRDPAILRAALNTGRMVSVTYNGHDPHYSGTIAHMVNLVHMDDKWAVVLDNNFIGENELVWLPVSEFMRRWCGGGNGWAVILLAPAPSPVPKN